MLFAGRLGLIPNVALLTLDWAAGSGPWMDSSQVWLPYFGANDTMCSLPPPGRSGEFGCLLCSVGLLITEGQDIIPGTEPLSQLFSHPFPDSLPLHAGNVSGSLRFRGSAVLQNARSRNGPSASGWWAVLGWVFALKGNLLIFPLSSGSDSLITLLVSDAVADRDGTGTGRPVRRCGPLLKNILLSLLVKLPELSGE